jgi:hypothetical protein
MSIRSESIDSGSDTFLWCYEEEAKDEPVSLRGVAAARETGNRSLKDTTFKSNYITNKIFKLMAAIGSVDVNFNAMLKVKLGRPMIDWLVKVGRLVGGQMSKSTVRVIISFLAKCHALQKKSGMKFLVIWLKAQLTNLQQAVAGGALTDMGPLGCRFKRTGGNLPRDIPALHRAWIRKGSIYHIRLWMSLFSIYRVLEFPGMLKLGTITDWYKEGSYPPAHLGEWSHFVINGFRVALEKFFLTDWLYDCIHDRASALRSLIVRPFQSLSSTPSVAEVQSTSIEGLLGAVMAWLRSPLLPILRDWLKLTSNVRFLNFLEEAFKWVPGLVRGAVGTLGKLGTKDEAAGKIRVFAMVDPITQWILKPLHSFLFEILKLIPQDGTFDQEKPLGILSKLGALGRPLYSFDLSAATDRLPVLFQAALLSSLIGAHASNLWIALLTGRPYSLPKDAAKATGLKEVWYRVGQPMGALTSWAMLAFTHHALVQWAAFRAGVTKLGEWFGDYAVLGDDIVIANTRVAKAYQEVMALIGVSIGLHKSLISRSGSALEFAKRFIVRGVSASPVPLLEVKAAVSSITAAIELARKYALSRSTLALVLGFGYKAVGSMNSSVLDLGSRLRGLMLAWAAPGSIASNSVLEFLTYVGDGRVSCLSEASMQSLFDSLKESLLKKISDMQPAMKKVLLLVTVDRTRAHYGTIQFNQLAFLSELFQRDLSAGELRFMHTLFEYVYREFYLDTLSEIRAIQTTLEDITLSTTALEWEALIVEMDRLDTILGSLPFFPKSSKRVQSTPRVSLPRWTRMWKRVIR